MFVLILKTILKTITPSIAFLKYHNQITFYTFFQGFLFVSELFLSSIVVVEFQSFKIFQNRCPVLIFLTHSILLTKDFNSFFIDSFL